MSTEHGSAPPTARMLAEEVIGPVLAAALDRLWIAACARAAVASAPPVFQGDGSADLRTALAARLAGRGLTLPPNWTTAGGSTGSAAGGLADAPLLCAEPGWLDAEGKPTVCLALAPQVQAEEGEQVAAACPGLVRRLLAELTRAAEGRGSGDVGMGLRIAISGNCFAAATLRREAEARWSRLRDLILTPGREEAAVLSADPAFASLLQERPGVGAGAADKAGWPAGQVALDHEPGMAAGVQRSLIPTLPAAPLPAVPRPAIPETGPHTAAVAVITRTMDRPMLLRRALQSVAMQSFRDYVHVVVCDGGPFDDVIAAATAANADPARILLIDGGRNRGMEAASNLAIRAVASRHVVIHDDDDSWEPDFLARTTAFLDGPEGAAYAGVVTHSTRVTEAVRANGLEVLATAPDNPRLETLQLAEHAIANSFPPIAFLFRRSIWEEVGGFDETLPVLGDWDFNLRVLARADIAVLRAALANYHIRVARAGDAFGNTVTAGRDRHVEYRAVVRNRALRRDAPEGRSAAGPLVGLASTLRGFGLKPPRR